MNRLHLLAATLSLAALSGCGGSGMAPVSAPTTQNFGSLTTRIVGAAQSPVTSSATNGANVTAIAGALVDRLTLNFQGANTLSDTKIAFARGNEILVMDTDGANQTFLTSNAFVDANPVWSPDGTKVAFETNRDGNQEIYVMNADGSNPVRLTNNAASDTEPAWSPDGAKIAFKSLRDQGAGEIYTMNAANGASVTRLTSNFETDSNPAWSPDGVKIAFFSTRDHVGGEIYTMNNDGSNVLRLTSNASVDDQPSWSPDGTKIAFIATRDGNREIYTMNADGSSAINRTNTADQESHPCWSPDGTRIAFDTFDGNNEVYSMLLSGSGRTNLSRTPGSSDVSPSWSTYLPRTPKTLVGAGGALGTAAAGFFYGQKAGVPKSVVAFETSTVGSRAGARVASQSAPFNDQGADLIFSVTTSAGLASVNYVNLDELGNPGAAVLPTIPVGSTGAIVSFIASNGNVGAVIPYAANRSRKVAGDRATYTGSFTAVYDAKGKNLAPQGATSVTLDKNTGKLLGFE